MVDPRRTARPRIRPGAHTLAPLALAGAALGLILAGCGNLTAGGFGEVRADMVGDGGGESFVAESALPGIQPGIQPGTQGANHGGGAFQGDVTVEVQLLVRDGSGAWVEVTDGPRTVELDARGDTPVAFATATLPEGGLDRVRIVFHRVEVLVLGGPPGLGPPVGERVEVDFGSAPTLEVERPLAARVGDDPLGLRVNLRSGVWLRTAVMGRVPGQSFRAAVRVEVLAP